ncbi:MAG: hypothetical protein IPH69_15480 [Bacteroidales bacterium]|nr:hypothetical protein [Bacteroidales bacterium]
MTTTELGCVSPPSNEVIKYVYAALTTGAIGSNQDVCYNITASNKRNDSPLQEEALTQIIVINGTALQII